MTRKANIECWLNFKNEILETEHYCIKKIQHDCQKTSFRLFYYQSFKYKALSITEWLKTYAGWNFKLNNEN